MNTDFFTQTNVALGIQNEPLIVINSIMDAMYEFERHTGKRVTRILISDSMYRAMKSKKDSFTMYTGSSKGEDKDRFYGHPLYAVSNVPNDFIEVS